VAAEITIGNINNSLFLTMTISELLNKDQLRSNRFISLVVGFTSVSPLLSTLCSNSYAFLAPLKGLSVTILGDFVTEAGTCFTRIARIEGGALGRQVRDEIKIVERARRHAEGIYVNASMLFLARSNTSHPCRRQK
jgi:hypothetical protein